MDFRKIIESKQPKKEYPDFRPGDTVKVFLKITEGDKERVQAFEGLVIARYNTGIQEAFTVRRVSYGVGVERKFFICSPTLEKIELVKKGMVKRAKLYYLREKSRKEGRIKEKLEEQLKSGDAVPAPEIKAEEAKNEKVDTVAPAVTGTETKKKEKKEPKKETKKTAKKEKAPEEKKA